jgi:hypothetical protein
VLGLIFSNPETDLAASGHGGTLFLFHRNRNHFIGPMGDEERSAGPVSGGEGVVGSGGNSVTNLA